MDTKINDNSQPISDLILKFLNDRPTSDICNFTQKFIDSFILNIQYLNKDIDLSTIQQWQGVILDICEIIDPNLSDCNYFSNLDLFIENIACDIKNNITSDSKNK